MERRQALVVSKPVPAAKVPQKARPRIRVRLAQDVEEVEDESYDVSHHRQFPLHQHPSLSEGAAHHGAPFTFGAPVRDQVGTSPACCHWDASPPPPAQDPVPKVPRQRQR